MAALGHTVDPDGGGDYVSLNALNTAQGQDLTDGGGDTYTATCTSSSSSADTTAAAISGWTTAAANYIEVVADTNHEAKIDDWYAARYRLSVSDSDVLTIGENYVRVHGLQIELTDQTAEIDIIRINGVSGGDNLLLIYDCRIRGAGNGGQNAHGVRNVDPDTVLHCWNCIVTGCPQGSCYRGNGTVYFYNCLAYGSEYGFEENSSTNYECYNCVAFACDDDFEAAAIDVIDYCASDDNDGTNNVGESGGGAAWPNDFVDAANGDFTLKSGSNLIGAASVDPSGSGYGSPDIAGTARGAAWDVGPFEYVAPAAGGLSIPIVQYHEMRRRL